MLMIQAASLFLFSRNMRFASIADFTLTINLQDNIVSTFAHSSKKILTVSVNSNAGQNTLGHEKKLRSEKECRRPFPVIQFQRVFSMQYLASK